MTKKSNFFIIFSLISLIISFCSIVLWSIYIFSSKQSLVNKIWFNYFGCFYVQMCLLIFIISIILLIYFATNKTIKFNLFFLYSTSYICMSLFIFLVFTISNSNVFNHDNNILYVISILFMCIFSPIIFTILNFLSIIKFRKNNSKIKYRKTVLYGMIYPVVFILYLIILNLIKEHSFSCYDHSIISFNLVSLQTHLNDFAISIVNLILTLHIFADFIFFTCWFKNIFSSKQQVN